VGVLPGSIVSGILTTKQDNQARRNCSSRNKNDKALLNRLNRKVSFAFLDCVSTLGNYRATVWPYLNQQLTEEENA
jgi:hypothetical protein